MFQGHKLAANLAKQGIPTTLVPDSSIFALMPRVNKVLLGTSLVLGDGGIRGVTGSHSLTLCAKHHAVPVIVLAPSYKFSPRYGIEQTSNLHVSPHGVLSHFISNVHVHNPAFDYVPPEYITLILSNMGGYEASFTYLLLRELYGSTDITSEVVH
ncbi:hypothetical protein B566_EDAN014690 [Ephemera danica]|nr:hypothetical protein B566_EDAN014690 [Ephemera danica]